MTKRHKMNQPIKFSNCRYGQHGRTHTPPRTRALLFNEHTSSTMQQRNPRLDYPVQIQSFFFPKKKVPCFTPFRYFSNKMPLTCSQAQHKLPDIVKSVERPSPLFRRISSTPSKPPQHHDRNCADALFRIQPLFARCSRRIFAPWPLTCS